MTSMHKINISSTCIWQSGDAELQCASFRISPYVCRARAACRIFDTVDSVRFAGVSGQIRWPLVRPTIYSSQRGTVASVRSNYSRKIMADALEVQLHAYSWHIAPLVLEQIFSFYASARASDHSLASGPQHEEVLPGSNTTGN